MEAYRTVHGLVLPIDRAHVDTDAIIPKQFMKSVQRTGFGPYLFDEWRFLDRGEPGQDCSSRPRNPRCALNEPRYRGAEVLLARENFGCGSSREHAAWALRDFGIRVLIAPSFADIFLGNCFKNGMLPIVLDGTTVDALFRAVARQSGYRLQIDLEAQVVTTPDEQALSFEVDPFKKHCLLNGLDDISLALARAQAIRAYESRRRMREPWLFPCSKE